MEQRPENIELTNDLRIGFFLWRVPEEGITMKGSPIYRKTSG
jgi:hypothetical protein